MLSKKNEQYLRSLSLKKFRQKYNNFIIEGDKMVLDLLHTDLSVESVFGLEGWIDKHASLLQKRNIPFHILTEKELKKISSFKTPNQVLAVVQQINTPFLPENLKGKLSLYLDRIQNPGNLGTILRSADWFGIDYVICSKDCADLYNPKVIQATMSALFKVKVIREDFEDLGLKNLNLPIYGAILKGENIFKQKRSSQAIIVVGSEGKGIRPEWSEHISHPISIPSYSATGSESLNAAIACSIILAAFRNEF